MEADDSRHCLASICCVFQNLARDPLQFKLSFVGDINIEVIYIRLLGSRLGLNDSAQTAIAI